MERKPQTQNEAGTPQIQKEAGGFTSCLTFIEVRCVSEKLP